MCEGFLDNDQSLTLHECSVVLTFSVGAGPVPSLLLSEILPGRIRAKAMAICMSVHWVMAFSESSSINIFFLSPNTHKLLLPFHFSHN